MLSLPYHVASQLFVDQNRRAIIPAPPVAVDRVLYVEPFQAYSMT